VVFKRFPTLPAFAALGGSGLPADPLQATANRAGRTAAISIDKSRNGWKVRFPASMRHAKKKLNMNNDAAMSVLGTERSTGDRDRAAMLVLRAWWSLRNAAGMPMPLLGDDTRIAC
jgi:hypothetical protein